MRAKGDRNAALCLGATGAAGELRGQAGQPLIYEPVVGHSWRSRCHPQGWTTSAPAYSSVCCTDGYAKPREYVKTSKTEKEAGDRMVRWSKDTIVGAIGSVS